MGMTREDAITLAAVILHDKDHGPMLAYERAERLYALAIKANVLAHTGTVVVAAAVLLSKGSMPSEQAAIDSANNLYVFARRREVDEFNRRLDGLLSQANPATCGSITDRDLGDEHQEALA